MQTTLLWPGMKRPITQNAFLEPNQIYAKTNLEITLREGWISSPSHQSWNGKSRQGLSSFSTFEDPRHFQSASRVFSAPQGFDEGSTQHDEKDSTWPRKDSFLPYWRLNRNMSSYTGYIPGMKDCFAVSYVPASETARSATALYPIRDKFEYASDGTRTVYARRPIMGGNTSLGVMKPASSGSLDEDIHVQGSRVDYHNYLKTLEAHKYDDLKIKTGSPTRNKSSNHLGDRYFYNGAHMFESTYQELICSKSSASSLEATEPASRTGRANNAVSTLPNICSSRTSVPSLDDQYRAAAALVGKERLSKLKRILRWKVSDYALGGALGGVIKACPKTENGQSTWLTTVSLHSMCRMLGMDVSQTEAKALFGEFDFQRNEKIESNALVNMLLASNRG